MSYSIQHIKNGLTAFQIKVIALVCMTLDHLAAFGFEIPIIGRYETYLRAIGRIAAPLFLFLLVQSIRHTRSKPKFVLRLYLAGMCVGLFDTAMNMLTGEALGYRTPGNIIFTFFYVALYIVLIEGLISSGKKRDFRVLALLVLALALSLVPTIFGNAIYEAIPVNSTASIFLLPMGIRPSLIPSFNDVDYGIGFILLGIILYFAKTKRRQCWAFALFCVFCYIGAWVEMWYPDLRMIETYGLVMVFFDRFQCRMVFALPFMLLYNGERGKKGKWFFYWYYPLHRQLIFIISALVT